MDPSDKRKYFLQPKEVLESVQDISGISPAVCNHSCDPNVEHEKWEIEGPHETCVFDKEERTLRLK